jgi:hypothetical protein
LPLESGDSDRKILKEIYEYMSKEFKRKANHALAVQEFVKNMDSTQVDVNVLRDLYPNPRPLEPTSICGYCVGGTLMAYVDGITAAMADAGEKPSWRAHYFPRVPELTEILKRQIPDYRSPWQRGLQILSPGSTTGRDLVSHGVI